MIKHIAIALGAATLSFIPTLAHAQEGSSGQTPVDVEVYPPELGVQPPPPVVVVRPPAVNPGVGSLPASGTDSTTMLLQAGSLLLVAGGVAVVATHRRRGAAAPA